MDEPALVIEPLASQHDRTNFSCGEPALDAYLQRQASQDMRRRIAQVFVAVGDGPGMIAGYYTVSAASFQKDELPPALAKRLPHYPVPAAVLGRLAVDRGYQGRGLGELLLARRDPPRYPGETRRSRSTRSSSMPRTTAPSILRARWLSGVCERAAAPFLPSRNLREARTLKSSESVDIAHSAFRERNRLLIGGEEFIG